MSATALTDTVERTATELLGDWLRAYMPSRRDVENMLVHECGVPRDRAREIAQGDPFSFGELAWPLVSERVRRAWLRRAVLESRRLPGSRRWPCPHCRKGWIYQQTDDKRTWLECEYCGRMPSARRR